VGPENITAVYSSINSSSSSEIRAEETAKAFGVKLISINLSQMFEELTTAMMERLEDVGFGAESLVEMQDKDPTILGSLRSCIRAPIGRGFNRMSGGGIRHGTGNECEDRWLRFYQKGGDGEVDTNPIAMLSKGEVFQLAVGLGVPMSVLNAIPSPDLQGVGEEGHNDEDELKALTGVDWTYSKVNPETGEYTSTGSIEKLSRLADTYSGLDPDLFFTHPSTPAVTEAFSRLWLAKFFPGYTLKEQINFMVSAKELERTTRHKMNPNCPSLGIRKDLLDSGILTNELSKL
jgi:NH3-dependent NAD+ synthetase